MISAQADPSAPPLDHQIAIESNLGGGRRFGPTLKGPCRAACPWKTKEEIVRVRSGDSESLKLETSFDKMEAKVTEEITCHVKAERIGFRGYGMMLAEIGLPPGADVDRASLETAVKGSGWAISQYDILPDRVVLYLWPRAGGSQFSFKFRPRMAMTAKAAASTVYDYYNPEAKAVVAPGTLWLGKE